MKKEKSLSDVLIYQTRAGALQLRLDAKGETIWATQAQMAAVFEVNPQAVTKHLRNIYKEKELQKKATCSKLEQVRTEGRREVKRSIEIYNLDVVIAVGYRISSKAGTKFRQWATKTLRAHLVEGYTINKLRIANNYQTFIAAVEKVRKLLPSTSALDSGSTLELVKMFAATWFSLDAYDKSDLPSSGASGTQVEFTAKELSLALSDLKFELIDRKEASDLFGIERTANAIGGIVGNVFQSFGGMDVYPTVEEKAAH